MSTASLIAYMRRREADLADTTVTVTRATTDGTFDPATATYATGTTSTIYTGKALIRPVVDVVAQAGDTSVDVSGFTVKFPADTSVELGDLIEVTESVHDQTLIGQVLRIDQADNDEWQITKHCHAVLQATRPGA